MSTTDGAAAFLDGLSDQLEAFLVDFAPTCLTATDAARVVTLFDRLERLAFSGKTVAARRAADGAVHRKAGHRSPAEWLATTTGASVGEARGTLELGGRLIDQPAIDEAFRAGRLSKSRASLIAGAVQADPAAEDELLAAAESAKVTLRDLGDRCDRIKAAARTKESAAARYERQHRARHLRTWTDGEGSFCFKGSLAPDVGAGVLSTLQARAKEFFEAARSAKEPEGHEAYLADALVALVTSPPVGADGQATGKGSRRSGQGPTMHIRVDLEALRNGHPVRGELCEIPGVGSIPVEQARNLLGDALLHVIITDGVDVTTVCRLGRHIPDALRQALIERDPVCVVPECSAAAPLEIDHWRVDFADGGPTALDNLARLCHGHHRMKTLGEFRLEGGPGAWEFVPQRE